MKSQPTQNFAEMKIDALYEAWESAPNPNDPAWRRQYAAAAIAAQLPCYDEHGVNAGAEGWRQWVAAANG